MKENDKKELITPNQSVKIDKQEQRHDITTSDFQDSIYIIPILENDCINAV